MMWSDFEHQMWAQFKKAGLQDKESYLIAVSGGLDSVALLHLVLRLKPKAKIRVVHYHHGPSQDPAQQKYRDDVLEFLKHKISSFTLENVSFSYEKSRAPLHSEAEMRDARWAFIKSEAQSNEPILTGHHSDDWVETTLLKMLRGTSLTGIANFKVWNESIFRPFLQTGKDELKKYVEQHALQYIDDPSNQSEDYFRNWIREKWLKDLESHRTGSCANLTRSLWQMVEEYQQNSTFDLKFFADDKSRGLERAWFLTLSSQDQLKALALFLKSRHIFEFTRGQLEEIRKRLDVNQKFLTFEIFERKWVINAMQIMLE